VPGGGVGGSEQRGRVRHAVGHLDVQVLPAAGDGQLDRGAAWWIAFPTSSVVTS
jgi:hypothetical protein